MICTHTVISESVAYAGHHARVRVSKKVMMSMIVRDNCNAEVASVMVMVMLTVMLTVMVMVMMTVIL